MGKPRGGLSAAPVALGDAEDITPGLAVVANRVDDLDADGAVTTVLADDAGVPARYCGRSLHGFVVRPGTTAGLKAARKAASEGSGLVLVGPPGTGKTHLAVGILRVWAERHLKRWPNEFVPAVGFRADGEMFEDPNFLEPRPPFRGRFQVVPDLLDDLRRRITAPEMGDPLEPLFRASTLVLDDLGREKPSEWVLDRVFLLINRRYNDLRPTIVTSNFSLDQLAARGYGPIVSRLVEDAPVVRLSGDDYRKVAHRG